MPVIFGGLLRWSGHLGKVEEVVQRPAEDAAADDGACDRGRYDEALGILNHQRETWALLMEQIAKQKAADAAAKIDMPGPNAKMEAMISVRG